MSMNNGKVEHVYTHETTTQAQKQWDPASFDNTGGV